MITITKKTHFKNLIRGAAATYIFGFLFVSTLLGAMIRGTIKSQLTNRPIQDALIILIKNDDSNFTNTRVSNQRGDFQLQSIEEGIYKIEAIKDGYYSNMLFDVKIQNGQTYNIEIKLLKQNRREHKYDDSDFCFMIGGIEVHSKGEEIIPEITATTRQINSGEIEHLQASNLGDILTLIPGIEKSKNPGLGKPSRVGLRTASIQGSDGIVETFGSTVIIDGNEISNDANANMLASDGRSGIDLRTIPADNIESVEVVTGIPSVGYKNFSNGLIKVTTKSGIIAKKFKAKINPDTKTASYSGGYDLANSVIDYHLNYGFSERDPRKEKDEYHRIYSNILYLRKFFNDKLQTKLRANYTKFIDNEEPTDILKTKNYNKGYKASGSFSFDYQSKSDNQIKAILSLDINRRKFFREKWVSDPVIILQDTLLPIITGNDTSFTDTTVERILPGYIGALQEIGKEYCFSGKLQNIRTTHLGDQEHRLLSGLDFDCKTNTGDGIIIDHHRNYYGLYSSRRSYSYDDYSDIKQIGFFGEDLITGFLFRKKYKMIFGFRYDLFNPADKTKSRQYHFLSPRFNLHYFINEDFRLRMGAGQSVKMVSLAYLYKPPAYQQVLHDSIFVEEKQLQQNPNLKAYSTWKYEISLDWQIKKLVGFSLTSYYSTTDNRPSSITYPWGYNVNPDTITALKYSIYRNQGWSRKSGIEFSVKTKRIKNIKLRMNLAYLFNKTGRAGSIYDSNADTTINPVTMQPREDIWYSPNYVWREKIIVNYQINYISQRLGAWITIEAQQVPVSRRKYIYKGKSYMKTEQIENQTNDYLFYQGMNNWYDNKLFDYGGKWLFNLRISKSLSSTTEMSIYINNVFDDRGVWENPFTGKCQERNSEIYYGLEISSQW